LNPIKFSVIIPAYNNAEYLGEAIQSVLDQSYPNFELIVVNDASPDNTLEVVKQFKDPRIKYIVHSENKGLSAARNTGICESNGDWIALLDGDDFFHSDKLKFHAEFINNHPGVGVTYNPRFELNHSARTIRDIWRPPLHVSLADLVQGFPFGPSDMVVNKDWMLRVGLFDVTHTYVGEDLDINCRLALAGCAFLSVDRALNYRRYYSGRILKNLHSCVEDTIHPLDNTFRDPRCPADAIAVQNTAYSNHYILWSLIAFLQEEIDLGQELYAKAVKYDPRLLSGEPCRFMETTVHWCIMDDSAEHDLLIDQVLYHLPADQERFMSARDWAVAKGFFSKGVRGIIWDRQEAGISYLRKSFNMDLQIDEKMLGSITSQLQNYEHEYGNEAAINILYRISSALYRVGWHSESHKIKGMYFFNRAFQRYHERNYHEVPKEIGRAISHHPRYLSNRGALSILFNSISRSLDKR
jgi:glycosyltransferase involved in cell wall biosynthesis